MSDSAPHSFPLQRYAISWQWLVLCGLGVVAFVLGLIGYMQPAVAGVKGLSFLNAVYDSLKLFHMHFDDRETPLPWTLQVARFLAPLVVGFAFIKAFFVVAHGHHRVLLHQSQSGHIVICGLGRKALQLARHYRGLDKWVVVIEKDPNNVLLRECENDKILYWIGDAGQAAQLKKARVQCADILVAATGDDGKNVEVAMHASKLSGLRPPAIKEPLRCLVHIVDPQLRNLFRENHVFDKHIGRFQTSMIDFYETCALALFKDHPLDGKLGIQSRSKIEVRLVIVSFGQMGESVLLQAARIGHFAGDKKVQATIIDPQAARLKLGFYRRYPNFDRTCVANFIDAEFDSPAVDTLIEQLRSASNTVLTFAVCCDDDARSMTIALALRSRLKTCPAPILARMATTDGLATLLPGATGHGSTGLPPGTQSRFDHIYPFATLEEMCMPDAVLHERLDETARAIQAKYIAAKEKRCQDSGEPSRTDAAVREWDQLDEDYKNSNRQQVLHHQIKLRAIGCVEQPGAPASQRVMKFTDAAEIELLEKMEHERWCAERWLAGWEHGKHHDLRERKHPDLGPWQDLSPEGKIRVRESVEQIPELFTVVRRSPAR